VGLGAATLSLFALWRAHAMVRDVDERARRREEEKHELEERMESLAGRLQELERCPAPPPPVQGHPRLGMNLNKRSQALRLHRQGESSEQIAASLELPRQEVELLLKVHRIVLANV
jgi:DNA-binding NarL/FixJ family response regulator